MDHNYCGPDNKDPSEQVDDTGLGSNRETAENDVLLTLSENKEGAKKQGAMLSTIDGIMLHPEMTELSTKSEPTNEDLLITTQLEEELKVQDDDAKPKEFYNSLQHQEGFNMMGEAIDNKFASDEHFEKHGSTEQPDGPDEDYVLFPNTVKNNLSIATKLEDENFVSTPQNFQKYSKMEESQTINVKFVSSPQCVDSGNDQCEYTGRSLVNKPLPMHTITTMDDDRQRAAVSMKTELSVMGEHGRKPPYTCSVCGKDFKTEAVRTVHINQFHLDLIFSCYVCGMSFYEKSIFNKHILTHVEKCGVCGKNFAWLSLHMLTHTGERPHKCGVCGKVFIAPRNSSTGSTNLVSPNKKGFYDCNICKQKVSTWQHFTLHIKKHTLTEAHLTCLCSTTHVSSSDTQSLVASTQGGSQKCVICGKYIWMKESMSTHLLTHTGELPHKCELCGKLYRYKGILSKHMLTHREYPENGDSSMSEKPFPQKGDLKKQILIHTSTIKPSNLSKHLSEDNVCRQSLVYNNNTSNQVPINVERHYKGERCGNDFGEQSILRGHFEIHTVNQNSRTVKSVHNEPIDESCVNSKQNEKEAMPDLSINQNPCSFCGNRFQATFELHLQLLTHFQGRPRDCGVCVHGFTSEELLLNHLINHIESSGYDSSAYVIGVPKKIKSLISDKEKWGIACNHSSKSPSTARDPSNEQPDKCDVWPIGINKKHISELVLTRTGERPHKCGVCGKGFKQKCHLMNHIFTHTGDRPHICGVCGNGFKGKRTLANHMLTHTGECPYKCDQCGKGFKQKGNLTYHILTHTGERRHKCGVCGKGYIGKRKLTEHIMFTHTEERPHKCDQCGKGFTKKYELKNHMLTHTGERPVLCSVCGKGYIVKCDLNTHMLTHTGERPHKCRVCGKGFIVKFNLTHHMLSHTGERPHLCDVCGKGFISKGSIIRHMLTHTGERPYKCSVCEKGFSKKLSPKTYVVTLKGNDLTNVVYGKGFTERHSVTEHMLTHIGECPHKCTGSMSEKRFGQKDLARHMLTHTDERPHKCTMCVKRFSRKG